MEQKETSVLVQQKIKKMLTSKRKLNKKEQPQLMNRFKSSHQNEDLESNPDRQNFKPSSVSKKRSNSVKNMDAFGQNQGENNVKEQLNLKLFIDSAFEYGLKIKQFLKNNDLSLEKARQMIVGNELFLLALPSKLNNINPEKHQQRTEKQMIKKLTKMIAMNQQKLNCEKAQQKINLLIQERLQQLKKY